MKKESVKESDNQRHFYETLITVIIAVVVALFVVNLLLPRGAKIEPVSLREIESETGRVVPSEVAYNMRQLGEDIVFVDIREQEEFAQEHIPGSIWIPHSKLRENSSEAWTEVEAIARRNRNVVFYCGRGHRSGWLAVKARERGLTNAYNLDGLNFWKQKFPTIKGMQNPDTMPRLIHLDEAYFYYTNYTDVIFVDTRDIKIVDGKIKGAVILNDDISKLNCDDEHVFYCEPAANEVCKSSAEAVRKLVVEKGCSVSRHKYLIEGFNAWKNAGYPVEKVQAA